MVYGAAIRQPPHVRARISAHSRDPGKWTMVGVFARPRRWLALQAVAFVLAAAACEDPSLPVADGEGQSGSGERGEAGEMAWTVTVVRTNEDASGSRVSLVGADGSDALPIPDIEGDPPGAQDYVAWTRLDQTNARLHTVETTLLDLAQQQRFVVRHLKGLAERDHRLEHELHELRSRVDRIEARLGPE